MNKYIVEVTEVLQKKISIDADSIEEAISKTKELYQSQKIILDDTNYIETNFEVIEKL